MYNFQKYYANQKLCQAFVPNLIKIYAQAKIALVVKIIYINRNASPLMLPHNFSAQNCVWINLGVLSDFNYGMHIFACITLPLLPYAWANTIYKSSKYIFHWILHRIISNCAKWSSDDKIIIDFLHEIF